MKSWIFMVVISIISMLLYIMLNTNSNSDIIQNINDTKYPFENHTVYTEDGYILTLFRIPYDKNNTYRNKNRTPVLLMHGLLGSFTDFFALGTNESLPYLLADQGYDVWLGNARGTTWSRKHKLLNPDVDNEQYWNFSWHEIGVIDIPTFIDYILKTTEHKQIQLIGHSQGSATIFILLSEKPEYNAKVKFISATSPGVFMNETKSTLMTMGGKYLYAVDKIIDTFGLYELGSDTGLISKYLKTICSKHFILNSFCVPQLNLFAGPLPADKKIVQKWIENFPAGASMKQLTHYFQVIKSNFFLKFNHGENRNLEMYGQTDPPAYDLQKVTAPVVIYYSKDDWLLPPRVTRRLMRVLPNIVKTVFIESENFNHGCFIFCNNVLELVNKPMIEDMNKYK